MAKNRKPKNFYATYLPIKGIYKTWAEVKPIIKGHDEAEYHGFETYQEALEFTETGYEYKKRPKPSGGSSFSRTPLPSLPQAPVQAPSYTATPDLSSSVNAGYERFMKDASVKLEEFTEYIQDSEKGDKELGEDGGEKLLDVQEEDGFAKYYAVARGRKPGIYETWFGEGGAMEQVHRFSNAWYESFKERGDAIAFMCQNHIPLDEIRLFRKTFKPLPNFTPQPTASFNEEFNRFAATQNLDGPDKRKAKVDAIHDALIHHCLPGGITVDQEDDEEGIILTEDQTLKIYQQMCRLAGKRVLNTIDDSLLELKRSPYVNIMDFVNTYRTGKQVRTFNDWQKFVNYTLAGNKIDVQYASNNEFLAPLLQDLNAERWIDPIKVRKRLLANRAERMRKRTFTREKLMSSIKPEAPSLVPERNFSPPAPESSLSPSRSSTPTPDPLPEWKGSSSAFEASMLPSSSPNSTSCPSTPVLTRPVSVFDQPHIKLESSSPSLPMAALVTCKVVEYLPVQEAPSVQTCASLKRARATPSSDVALPSLKQGGTQSAKRRKGQAKVAIHGRDIRSFFRGA